jgi:exodeoxyribonuclease VII large subunit
MRSTTKSQWDFGGELFPTREMHHVFSVTEVTATIRRLIEERIGNVWVTGEVSNCRFQTSGHIYFSIKDFGAQLACVCFRDEARGTRELLQDGRKVVLQGDLTVYETRGQYQLLVKSVELEGVGALQVAFEKLKLKLAGEGLFESGRKRSIPPVVHSLAVVTSPTGAALRDVLQVIARRDPTLTVVLAACRVQGQGAAEEIARGIELFNDWAQIGNSIDAILLTRGGGSLEDLWAFNEEVVARAIFHSRLPVVSAIGHEIDFTISDFVADLRAATPSAGAELLTEGMFRRREWIVHSALRLLDRVCERIEISRETLVRLSSRLARMHPKRVFNDRSQYLDELQISLIRCSRKELRRNQLLFLNLAARQARVKPSKSVGLLREILLEQPRRLQERARYALALHHQRLLVVDTRLRLLSPQHVLERGFSITQDAESGEIIRDVKQVRVGQRLRTELRTGIVISTASPNKD